MKEVRDLIKDPKILFGMILVPLVMFPVMGLAINVSTESIQKSVGRGNLALMDMDEGNFSSMPVRYFSSLPNVTVNVLPPQGIDSAIRETQRLNSTSLLVIPPGFSAAIAKGEEATFMTYTPLKTLGLSESARAGLDSNIVASFGSFLTAYYISAAAPSLNPSIVMRPLSINASSYINGQLLSVSPTVLIQIMMGQSILMPMAMMIVTVLAMQIAATAIAVEKEQKTLETLLTLPVSRFQILAAKLLGSTVIAGLGATATIAGFSYYMNTLTSSFGRATVSSFSLTPPISYYVILGGLIFLTLALATSLAIVVGVFSDDVRGAQAVVGYMILPVLMPSVMVMLGDLQTFPWGIQAILLAIPFTYTMAFSKMAFIGDFTVGILGLGYNLLWTVALLYVGSRLFGSEKILTVRISFARKRRAIASE